MVNADGHIEVPEEASPTTTCDEILRTDTAGTIFVDIGATSCSVTFAQEFQNSQPVCVISHAGINNTNAKPLTFQVFSPTGFTLPTVDFSAFFGVVNYICLARPVVP